MAGPKPRKPRKKTGRAAPAAAAAPSRDTAPADAPEVLDAAPDAETERDDEPDADGPPDGAIEDIEVVDDDLLAIAGEDDVAVVPARSAGRAGGGRARERREGVEPAERGLGRRDPIAAYVAEIRKIPLLTREEELELSRKYFESHDMEVARRLVTANLRLVVKIAHEYRRAHRNLLDLIQEGNIGLMQAVKKYDPYRGVKLSSYAAWWIRAYILKFILNNWRLVKIGTTQAQRKLFFNLRKEKEKLERMGFEPEHRLLAERLDVTEKEVAEMERRLEGGESSLDAPVSRDDTGGATRLDMLQSAGASRPDVAVEAEEFRRILREKLEAFAATLEGRDQVLFRERWLTDAPRTLQEIGDQFGISRERSRQLEKRLLDRLRVYLEAELGTAVDIGAMAVDE